MFLRTQRTLIELFFIFDENSEGVRGLFLHAAISRPRSERRLDVFFLHLNALFARIGVFLFGDKLTRGESGWKESMKSFARALCC